MIDLKPIDSIGRYIISAGDRVYSTNHRLKKAPIKVVKKTVDNYVLLEGDYVLNLASYFTIDEKWMLEEIEKEWKKF